MFGFQLPETGTKAAGDTITISADHLNVREGPGLSYKVVGKVNKGDTFSIQKVQGDWYQISMKNGTGWVAGWLVTKNKAVNEARTGQVTADALRVRTRPGTSYQVAGSLKKGDTIKIIQEDNNWYEVSTAFGKGWVSKDYVQTGSPSGKAPASSEGKSGQITADSLNVRQEPSLQSDVIGKLEKGSKVIILAEQNGWTKISFSNKTAWISSDYVKITGRGQTSDVQQPLTAGAGPLAGQVGSISATTLNVRDSNSLNGKIIGKVTKGETFKLIEERNNWVKIQLKNGTYGWIAGWYIEKSAQTTNNSDEAKSQITILHDGTNIRQGPDLNTEVIYRANYGESFSIINAHRDWYEIQLSDGKNGFVAGWIVSANGAIPDSEKHAADGSLSNKTIMIDPGHGGRDNGTTGSSGTIEKKLTLQTSKLLYNKLRASGANVILTRNSDTYLSLSTRVSMAHYQNVDAFISIHYDSVTDSTVKGMTTYYYSTSQKPLAASIHMSTQNQTKLKNRGVRFGDYHVLRENRQKAVLIELGYLSNPTEELLLTSSGYQEQVTNGIHQGLIQYFKQF